MTDEPLSVAVVDTDALRAAILEEGLRDAGVRVTVIPDTAGLLARLVALAPDVVVIDLKSPSRDVLEQMFQVSRVVERPVAMFVDRSDTEMMQAAIEAGVSAYIVDGLKRERVKGIVDLAILRFNAVARMREELEATKSQLAERKLVERAKGILMKAKSLDEDAAYALMRRTAMNEKKRIVEIARAIVTTAEILK
jgi:two-component system, response regulator / RNA-binding antiterminator